MRFQIYVMDDVLSPDAEPAIYVDISLRYDLSPDQMQEMSLQLALFAQSLAQKMKEGRA